MQSLYEFLMEMANRGDTAYLTLHGDIEITGEVSSVVADAVEIIEVALTHVVPLQSVLYASRRNGESNG